MKPKVYFYPGSRDPTIYERDGWVDCVPFSPQGIERWIEPTGNPDEAQLFWCGQFHDKDAWRLTPNIFEFFQGRESRHVFDIEGDWRGMDIPEWLKPCVLTAVNAREKNREWNIMARPGCGKLLVWLAREGPRFFCQPKKRQFYFRGQRDSWGLRERVGAAFKKSGLPGEYAINAQWGAPADVGSKLVADFQDGMRESTFILCPGGEGWGFTLRMYEACAYGRIPILIADCLWVWEDVTDASFCFRIPPAASDDEIAKALETAFAIPESEMEDRCRMAALYFEHIVRGYFHDPTKFFLTWAAKRRLIG